MLLKVVGVPPSSHWCGSVLLTGLTGWWLTGLFFKMIFLLVLTLLNFGFS